MARKRDDYIDPVWITVEVDGEPYRELLSISRVGDQYQYSISHGDQHCTNTDELMPSTWHCEHYGKMDLLRMIEAERKQTGG
jgi:hypothetical protein